jgi:hypothetical protein
MNRQNSLFLMIFFMLFSQGFLACETLVGDLQWSWMALIKKPEIKNKGYLGFKHFEAWVKESRLSNCKELSKHFPSYLSYLKERLVVESNSKS